MVLALIPAALLVLVAAVAGVRLRALAAERDRLAAEVSSLRAGVTALEATAAELRTSEAAYRGLVDEASDWVWATDHVGTLTFSNPAGKAILGYPDLVGVPAAEPPIPTTVPR